MGKLDGKIALVTGSSSGIGLAAAKEFVGDGAYVFITGRRRAELAAAVLAANSVYSATEAAVRSFARTWDDRPEGPAHQGERSEPWLHRYAAVGT